MRSVVWFYLFWGLVAMISIINFMPELIGQNDTIDSNNLFFHLENKLQNTHQLSMDENSKNIAYILNQDTEIPYSNGIKEIRIQVNSFCKKIDNYKIALTAASLIKDKSIVGNKKKMDEIIQNSTIDTINFNGEKLCRKNSTGQITISREKDWTTYLFVEQEYGDELKELTINTRKEIIAIYIKTLKDSKEYFDLTEQKIKEKSNEFIENFTLNIDSSWKEKSDKNTWAEANFDHMPYAACMPILEQFKSKARMGETMMLNDISALLENKTNSEFYKVIPIVKTKSCQFKKGSVFEAQITAGVLSKNIGLSNSVTVNGQRIMMNKNGIGTYKETTNNIGTRILDIETICTNPLTGERLKANTVYEYIVTE